MVGGRSGKFEDEWERGGERGLVGEWDERGGRWESGAKGGGEGEERRNLLGSDWVGWCGEILLIAK